jgi:phthalate 4,5-cis-dihydrodiol dehydrogenase
MAGAMMVSAAATHPGIVLRAGADPLPAPRDAFARDFGARPYEDARQLCEDPAVEAVYIATPHQHHAAHAILAAEHGKHVIVEKPLALTLADCDAVIAAIERHGVHLIVGHTHAFDPNIRAMRRLVAEGALGRLGMIALWNYTNFLYRPRRPEELDTARGGGIVFNQLPHQIDVARLLGGGRVRSVRAITGILDPARPTEGNCTALLDFETGAAASLVYSGYDFFDSDELHFWVTEGGLDKAPGAHGAARRALAARTAPESQLRTARAYGAGAASPSRPPHLPHFGVTIVTGERGELRASADGVLLYDESGARELPVARGFGKPGHGDVLDAMWRAVRQDRRSLHDARWGKATLEVALAVLRSARERREITLSHQVPVPEGR